MLSPDIMGAAWAASIADCTADTLAATCWCLPDEGAELPSEGAALLPPRLDEAAPVVAVAALDAVLPLLAAAAAAASSPDTVGGSGVSGSAKGVQSGGPASKGDDLARCRLQADPTRDGLLPGEALLLELLLSACSLLPPADCAASLAKRDCSLLPAQPLCCCCCGWWSTAAAERGIVGAAAPGSAAAAVESASALLLVAR